MTTYTATAHTSNDALTHTVYEFSDGWTFTAYEATATSRAMVTSSTPRYPTASRSSMRALKFAMKDAQLVDATPAEQITELIKDNEAAFIFADLEDGVSLAGAMSYIDRGRRREANELRLAMGNEAFLAALREAYPATQADLPGYICKSCGGVAPVGIGYVDNTSETASYADSMQVTACPCGASQRMTAHRYPAAQTATEKVRAAEAEKFTPGHVRLNRRTAEQYRAAAAAHRESRAESFERCDTDGFLSQWADQQLEHSMLDLAQLAENGWLRPTVALFDTQGFLVPAVYREGTYGWYWGILDPAQPQGKFLEFFTESEANSEDTRRRNNAKKGYYVGTVNVPQHEGKGGRAEALIEYWQQGARIVDNGRTPA